MPRHLLILAVFALLVGCQPNTPLINPAPSASNSPSTAPPSTTPKPLTTPSPIPSPMVAPPAPTAVPNSPSPTPEAPAETDLPTVVSLSLAPSKVELAREGAQTQLIVYAKDAAGQLIDASQLELEWRSDKEQTFEIAADGLLTALGNSGSGLIHVRELRSGLTATVQASMSSRGSSSRGGSSTPQSTEPTLSSISPTSGFIIGGIPVVLTGTHLADATAVQFGALPAISFTVLSDTQISATPPPGVFGAVDVTVTTPEGTSGPVTYTYGLPPLLTLATPSAGPTAGGTTVTLTGSFLSGATAVDFGGTPATNINVVSDTALTVTAPAGTVGTVNITVTTPIGTSSSATYTYVATPTVTSLSPSNGAPMGGTSVTVTGTGFTGTTAVSFGANPATSFAVISPTQIAAIAPAGSAGIVNVTVNTPGGTSATSAADQFTYDAAPAVAGLTPNTGAIEGGTSVTVTGTGFTGATAVSFGGNPATSFTVISPTQISATAPAGAAGIVNVTVTTLNGTSATSAANQFTYVAGP